MANPFGIQNFNIGGAIQEGYNRGRFNRLASAAFGGSSDAQRQAVQEAINVDPEAGFALQRQVQGDEDRRQQRLVGAARFLEQARSTGNAAQLQGAWNAVRPQLERDFPGQAFDTNWNDEAYAPVIYQVLAQDTSRTTDVPGGVREFQYLTQGLPTEDVTRARRIELGLDPRAVTGAAKQLEITGSDGRTRQGIFNPTTQSIDVFDETSSTFRPLARGESARIPGPAPPQAPAQGLIVNHPQTGERGRYSIGADGLPVFIAEGVATNVAQTIQADPAGVAAGGVVEGAPQYVGGFTAMRPVAAPGVGVSRTPEEQEFLSTMAQEQAKLDAYDRATASVVDREAQTAAARETGQARAQSAQALPQTIAAAEETVALLDRVLTHPGRIAGTGTSAANPLNRIPGTPAYDFNVLLDQIKGQAFLQAFQSLRGGGAITEREGQAATNAIARLNAAQSEGEFVSAINDLKRIVSAGRDRAIQRAGQPTQGDAMPDTRIPDARRKALLDKY